MSRSKGGMTSLEYCVLLLAVFNIALCNAGPLPNVTMADNGLKEGSCALGDVVYMSGDSFPGTTPCESCACASGEVTCARQRCEPRPGCKAVHRPDHCCPTYQCECEQEGRIYGNGEKLVDPRDPCRVCYCQGGEVVCRRIACFLRDDCRPRLVPGRCCPEYDNCPLRGVTSLPDMASSSSLSSNENVESSPAPSQPVEPPMPSITIKEITPVSEIPVTGVKIKEILPSPGMELEEYTSPKSPPIPREATSEKSASNMELEGKLDSNTKAVLSSSAPLSSKLPTTSYSVESGITNDRHLSKISVSTQNSISDHIVPTKTINVVAMMGSPSEPDTHIAPLTTKAPIIEEDDLSFLDHNPAFPPIPDDLSVLGNHDDEILPEQNLDNEHISMDHDIVSVLNPVITEAPVFKEATTPGYVSSEAIATKENSLEPFESSTFKQIDNTPTATVKDHPMLNMRSVIPTEILNAPSLISDDVTGDSMDVTESPTPVSSFSENVHSTENSVSRSAENKLLTTTSSLENISYTDVNEPSVNTEGYMSSPANSNFITPKIELNFTKSMQIANEDNQDETTNSLSKSTDVISDTEFSSIPIETSDQNPHETIDKDSNDTIDSTVESVDITSTKLLDSEVTTISREIATELKIKYLESGETTEFIPTSFGSQESSTDAVELINVASDTDKSSALIDPSSGHKTNALTDLINLVGDVASISDHTEAPDFERQTSKPTFSDSEELIPVNIASGYKSKNKNWNQNSITEVPFKNKVTKHKVVEIVGEDTDTITDSPMLNDKVEPTTRRAIIDNVSDENNENKTEITKKVKKDIEIITQSYVPTIHRRPTKVVMEKSDDKPIFDESSEEDTTVTTAPADVKDHTESNNDDNLTSVETESATEFLIQEPEAIEVSTVEPSATQ